MVTRDPRSVAVAGQGRVSMGDLPPNVARTVRFLTDHGVWFTLSRNAEARSCRDAARKRYRLGHVGIPVRDEMKSFFGRVTVDGEARFLAAHCRGDRLLDLDRVATAVGADDAPHRLGPEELEEVGMAYGLVNPFRHDHGYELDGVMITTPVLQVFDRDLLTASGAPATVMTNAGDLTWAVEFKASDLATAIAGSIEAEITVRDHFDPPRPPATQRRGIGIITGNAPESGIALWEAINATVRSFLGDQFHGDVSMPHTVVDSLPGMGLSMELDTRTDEVWETMCASLDRLCAADVGLVAIACNTTQYFVPLLRERAAIHGVEVVSMPEEIAAWLRSREVEEVGLIGIPFVSDLGRWSAYREPLAGLTVETPGERAMERLTELAYRVKVEGPNEGGLNQLRDILRASIRSDHVLLALTELSVLLGIQRKQGRSGKLLIDPLALYGEAIASRWLGRPFPPVETHHLLRITSTSEPGGKATNQDAVLLGDVVSRDAMEWPDQRELPVAAPITVAVADGLGGHEDGAFASQFVTRRLYGVAEHMLGHDAILETLLQVHDALGAAAATRRGAVADNAKRPSSTVAGLAVGPGALWAYNVGDSRVHRLAPGPVTQLSTDHLRPDGKLSQALGIDYRDPGIVDLGSLRDGLYLLCTDGLRIAKDPDDELAALQELVNEERSSAGDPKDDARLLDRIMARCRRRWRDVEGEADNVSAVLVRIIDLTDEQP